MDLENSIHNLNTNFEMETGAYNHVPENTIKHNNFTYQKICVSHNRFVYWNITFSIIVPHDAFSESFVFVASLLMHLYERHEYSRRHLHLNADVICIFYKTAHPFKLYKNLTFGIFNLMGFHKQEHFTIYDGWD
jgi:hypothetical protein